MRPRSVPWLRHISTDTVFPIAARREPARQPCLRGFFPHPGSIPAEQAGARGRAGVLVRARRGTGHGKGLSGAIPSHLHSPGSRLLTQPAPPEIEGSAAHTSGYKNMYVLHKEIKCL